MANVLITSEFFGKFSKAGKQLLLQAGHTVIDNPYGQKFLTPEEIIPHAGNADAMVCDLEHITKEVMDSAPNLKIISRRGVGVDSVDVAYAQEKGIAVARTLGVVEPPVAELVMAYILEFSRNISKLNQDMHNGIWFKRESSSVDQKTLGILGMGKIAREVARRACAFGMQILYYSLQRSEACEREFGAVYAPLDEVLSRADFVTLHMPLNEQTRGMLSYEAIAKMKPSAYLINTARGAIVEEDGLYRALLEKKIAGAAIDVYDCEPERDSRFRAFENVILTPHVGTFTREIFTRMDVLAAQNIIDFFARA